MNRKKDRIQLKAKCVGRLKEVTGALVDGTNAIEGGRGVLCVSYLYVHYVG